MVLTIGIAFTLILSKRPIVRITIGAAFLMLFGSMVAVGGIKAIAAQVIQSQTEQLDSTRQVIQYPDVHEYAPDVHFTSVFDIVKFLPWALFNFWGGPFLIGYGFSQVIVGLWGVLSWYATYWYAARGFFRLKGRNPYHIPLTVFIVVAGCLLSVICGNWAECVRLRSMLSIPLELMAGVGWVVRKERFFGA
jgi:hypothetical protein